MIPHHAMQVCKYASMHIYASMQVCTYASMHIYASMEVSKYAISMKVCKRTYGSGTKRNTNRKRTSPKRQVYESARWSILALQDFCHLRLLTDVTYTLSLSIHHHQSSIHHHHQTISHWPVQSKSRGRPSNIKLVSTSKCKQQKLT